MPTSLPRCEPITHVLASSIVAFSRHDYTLPRIIKSVLIRQAPVTLEWKNNPPSVGTQQTKPKSVLPLGLGILSKSMKIDEHKKLKSGNAE